MKTKIGIAVIAATMVATIQAEMIVKWGGNPADTEIVTANAKGLNQFGDTYDDESIGSPEDGTSDYLLSAPGQTRTFYGAMSTTNTVPIVNNSGRGDRIQMVHNFGGSPGSLTSMIAWQAGDFLASTGALESMTVSFASRGGDGTTMRFLIETGSGWYQSEQTEFADSGAFLELTGTNSTLTWVPFSKFGVTAGTGTPNTSDLQSVGLFSFSTNTGSNFIGGLVNHFEVTSESTPAPSSGLKIISMNNGGDGSLQIDFIGSPNTNYEIEYSPDLSTPFAPIADATTDSVGDGNAPIGAADLPASKGFFRVVSAP